MPAKRWTLPRWEITWHVNRLHVTTSRVGIVRALRPRMTGPRWTRARRKAAYRYAFTVHEGNRGMFAAVATGCFR